jgi:hypothetical protein
MQILEAALAFAITMLVLSLICSSFVELIHKFLGMREEGFRLMLGGMFDDILKKYVEPRLTAELSAANQQLVGNELTQRVATDVDGLKTSFLDAMKENRAPVRITLPWPLSYLPNLWRGEHVTGLKPEEFMERLAGLKVGDFVKAANDAANNAGAIAIGTVDAVLKDVAQKFDALGRDASAYFESRARVLSIFVAIVLAFCIRVDAVELFNTYLRDPNARNKVIEQSQAVTAQYKAAKEAADALQKVADSNPPPDAKAQVEALKKDWQATLDSTRNTVQQYSDLGLPIGWTKENATLDPFARTCISQDGKKTRVIENAENCNIDPKETEGKVGALAVLRLVGSLLLGGFLIGLGGPFWYNAVTGLTNIRGIARDVSGDGTKAAQQQASGAHAPPPQIQGVVGQPQQPPAAAPQPSNPDRPQPVTPVGNFQIAHAAKKAAPVPPAQPDPNQQNQNQQNQNQQNQNQQNQNQQNQNQQNQNQQDPGLV